MRVMQRGFTLIELVMVIVILGILSAVAIPKFVDLSADAAQASVNGVAGALASASATNYAARSLGSSSSAFASTVPVADCADVAGALQGGLPANFTIASLAVAAGGTSACEVTGPAANGSKTAAFTAMGIN